MANNTKTRSYKISKLNPKGVQAFGPDHALSQLVSEICTPHTQKPGVSVSVDWVVERVKKAKLLRITHSRVVRHLVSAAIREGSVPGSAGEPLQSKRGPTGGIFDPGVYKAAFGEEDYNRLRAAKDAKRLAKAS